MGFLSHRPPNTRHVQDVGCLGQPFPNGLTKTRNSGRRYDWTPSQKIIPNMKHHQTQKKTSFGCMYSPSDVKKKTHGPSKNTQPGPSIPPPKEKTRRGRGFKLKLFRGCRNLRSGTELRSRPQRREYAYYDPSRLIEVPCSFYLAPLQKHFDWTGFLAE